MTLIVGGSFQGKLDFAKSLCSGPEVMDGASCAFDEAYNKPVLYHLEALVARMLKQGVSPAQAVLDGVGQNPEIILVCAETGCGVVPVDEFQRRLREETGRLCCTLAQRAQKVYRVYCGVPTLIKDS